MKQNEPATGIPVGAHSYASAPQYPPQASGPAYANAPHYPPQGGVHAHANYAPQHPPQGGVADFSSGLFDCFSDTGVCCLTCWCPCITFGRIAEIVDKGSSSCGVSGALYALIMSTFAGCQFLYSCTYRSKMKAQYGMHEDSFADCCIHFWCETCALCQEYRELQHRGFDLPLGWHGNMERLNNGMVAPAMPGGMTR